MPARLGERSAVALTVTAAAMIAAYLSARDPLLAIAGLAFLFVAILVVVEPRGMLLLLVAALPWEGALAYPTEAVSVVKIFGALLFAGYAIQIIHRRKPFRTTGTIYAVGLFVLLVGISLIASPNPVAGLPKYLSYILYAGFFFLVIQLVDDRAWLLRVMRTMALSLSVAAVWGLISFISGETARASGPVGDPNEFGYVLAALLPLVGYLTRVDRDWRMFWALCFTLVLAAALATLSRGVIVSLVVLVAWAVVTGRVRAGGLIASTATVLAIAGVGALLFPGLINERLEQKGRVAGDNVASRQALWGGAVAMSMDYPLAGAGPARFGIESPDYVREDPIALQTPVTHNTYLEILAESGPFALAAFLAFLGGSWGALSRTWKRARRVGDRETAQLTSALQASLLVAAVGALFLSVQLAAPFWLIGALAVVAPRLAGASPSDPLARG